MKKKMQKISSFYDSQYSDKDFEGYLYQNQKINPLAVSIRIALLYCLIGSTWILFSGNVLSYTIKDLNLYKTLELYKGWFYVFITTILIFLIILRRLKQFELAIRKLQLSLQELSSTNEELVAMEEELKVQVEELNRNKTSLLISEERYELAVEGADCGIWDYDVIRGLWFFSAKIKTDLGYQPDEIINSRESWLELIHQQDREKIVKSFDQFLEQNSTSSYENIYRMRCKDGSYKWIQSKAKGIFNSDGTIIRVAGSHMDITKMKEFEHKLERLAYYDKLTELPNRVAFEKKMNEWILSQSIAKFALIYLDIDDFKNINDELGHVAGDYFLKHVAEKLKGSLSIEEYIARISGDEFTILYQFESKKDIEDKLKSLMELSKSSWTYMDRELFVTFSAGVTIYPDDGTNYLQLLKNSDIAMYTAKEGLKNTYCFFNDEINEKNKKRIEMIHELKLAIEYEQFELYYQPIQYLDNNELYSVEALIRWIHPEKGMIPPMDFIPLAEETGLICDIDKWVFKNAFRQKQIWESRDMKPFKLSINVSGKSFVNCNLYDNLSNLLNDIAIRKEEVQIEITETAYMEDIETSSVMLKKIKELGISIALDDFGTGYSSLTYLEKLPIDVVKLDRTFIMNTDVNNQDSIIIQNLIKLTHDLRFKIVAEGIESYDQLNFLQKHGCDYGQGYLFSKPLATEDFEAYYMQNER